MSFPDWMLEYADRERAKQAAREGVDEYFRARHGDGETPYDSAHEAGTAAVVRYLASRGDR